MAGSRPSALPPGSRPDQDLTRYDDMSEDELDALMKGGVDPTEPVEEEPEAEEVVEDPTEEEPEVEEGPAAEEAEEAEPVDYDKRIALLEARLERESLERVKETAARERAELMASKQAGRAGYLKQQLEKGAPAAKPQSAGAEENPWDAEEQAPASSSEEPTEQPVVYADDRGTHREVVAMAINDEGNKFAAERAEEFENLPEGFAARMGEIIAIESVPYREELLTGKIASVRKLSRTLYQSAYATARIEFADKLTAEATTRKAESVTKSIRRKKKAAISKTGQGPKPKAAAKSYEEMDDAELEAEFKKEFGDNYNPSRNTLVR
jgi:hypothetical protein